MTTNLPDTKKKEVYALLTNNMKAVKNVLPKHATPERMLRIAYQAIVQNPTLAQCSQISLMNSIIESSQLGLEIGGPLGQAYLLPFKGEATLVVGYRGMMDLAYRSGRISNFSAHPVYERDHFVYRYGLEPKLEHQPCEDEDPGPLKYAYAIVHFKGGGYDFEVITRRDAAATKKRSPGARRSDSPWSGQDEWTMWVKTAIRRLAKRIPQSPELQRAAALDEYADAGVNQGLSHVIDADFQINEPTTGTNSVKDKLKQKAEQVQKPEEPEAKPDEVKPCPEADEEPRSVAFCETKCKSREGCPAWE